MFQLLPAPKSAGNGRKVWNLGAESQSRGWEAAEFEEEGDDVKPGMNPWERITGIVSRRRQLCLGAAPGLEWGQCEEPARLFVL